MKLTAIFTYIFRAISYGIIIAIALLLLLPQLRDHNPLNWDIFKPENNTPPPLSYAKAVHLAAPAVVNIYSNSIQTSLRFAGQQRKQLTDLGSGVIMDSNGYILTNLHVVEDADLIEVILQSGQVFSAELIGSDMITDLAVLKINSTNLPVIPQREDIHSFVGDVVLAIGNPLNLGQTVTQGIISRTGRNGLSASSYSEFIQTDATINKGNSGGALINTNGELVGINSGIYTKRNEQRNSPNIQGISLAIPYKLANKVMNNIIENGRVIRGWLGISINSVAFAIDDITPNSPAEISGLQIGDKLVKMAGKKIQSIQQGLDIVAETKPGTTLLIQVYRNNQLLDIPVVIGEVR